MNSYYQCILPGEFEQENHWYPKAMNATIHPMIDFFLNLNRERIIARYCHMYPTVNAEKLDEILRYPCKHFLWAGADLLNVTTAQGKRRMVVIENNSCPSGQKSMPLMSDHEEQGGYRLLVERTFKPYIKRQKKKIKGALAVIYDKNPMEASGYAKVIADVFDEPVHFVSYYTHETEPRVKFVDRVLHVLDEEGEWIPIRAAFRYLTQKPWNRLPVRSKTLILNPIIACLAGGRNKMVAAKAYDMFNAELKPYGLHIYTPETIWNVRKNEIPLWVERLGGHAVIKVPYSNAGQGVFTIVSERELEVFMEQEFEYDVFIVQSLIGNYNWSSETSGGKLYHVGTIPNNKAKTYVADIRMMVSWSPEGIRPLCTYARKAAKPLVDHLDDASDSWAMLGTNLSIKTGQNQWSSDTNRLVMMDRRDFNKLGIGLDDLIEAYIQTVVSMVSIDQMAQKLISRNGRFNKALYQSLNNDESLLDEILVSPSLPNNRRI